MPCVNIFGLISGGCGTTAKTTIDQLIETKITSEILLRNVTRLSRYMENYQSVTLDVRGIECKNFNIGIAQEINGEMKVVDEVKQQDIVDLKQTLINQLEEEIQNLIKINTDFFSTQAGVDAINSVRTTITNAINTTIKAESITDLSQRLVNKQEAKIYIANLANATDCNITVTQNMLVSLVATSIIMQIQEIAIEDDAFNEAKTTIDNEIEVTEQGLWGTIKAGFDFLKSIGTGAVILFVVVAVCILIGAGLLIWMLVKLGQTPAGQKAIELGAQYAITSTTGLPPIPAK